MGVYGSSHGRGGGRRGGGALLFFLAAGAALLLRYGESDRLVRFREEVQVWAETRFPVGDYAQAVETLGRSIVSLRGEDSAVGVFARDILGIEASPGN